jgi:release factor glutamine methyltransferase
MSRANTVGACLLQGMRSLESVLDVEVLLAHALGTDRARIKAHPEAPLDAAQLAWFRSALQRRAAGEPVAYIVGHREFWTLRLTIGPTVLVPRPETELLVERSLALRDAQAANALDLGTGSGAVALALAHERPAWQVTGVDSSAAALDLARRNATALQLERIELLHGEWFAPVSGRRFDLIVGNPPYVAAGDPVLASAPLRFEPQVALAGGSDGLDAIRLIVQDAPGHLAPGGWLLLEHGATQAAAVAALLVARGFARVRSYTDLAGHERMTEGRWDHPSA